MSLYSVEVDDLAEMYPKITSTLLKLLSLGCLQLSELLDLGKYDYNSIIVCLFKTNATFGGPRASSFRQKG